MIQILDSSKAASKMDTYCHEMAEIVTKYTFKHVDERTYLRRVYTLALEANNVIERRRVADRARFQDDVSYDKHVAAMDRANVSTLWFAWKMQAFFESENESLSLKTKRIIQTVFGNWGQQKVGEWIDQHRRKRCWTDCPMCEQPSLPMPTETAEENATVKDEAIVVAPKSDEVSPLHPPVCQRCGKAYGAFTEDDSATITCTGCSLGFTHLTISRGRVYE